MSSMSKYYTESWCIITLVDITKTNVRHGQGKARNQQRNHDTLLQVISMLSQPTPVFTYNAISFELVDKNTRNLFGNKHLVTNEMFNNLVCWQYLFGVDHRDVLGSNGERLREMLHNIPVITGLDENANIDPPVFNTMDDDERNTIILP